MSKTDSLLHSSAFAFNFGMLKLDDKIPAPTVKPKFVRNFLLFCSLLAIAAFKLFSPLLVLVPCIICYTKLMIYFGFCRRGQLHAGSLIVVGDCFAVVANARTTNNGSPIFRPGEGRNSNKGKKRSNVVQLWITSKRVS